MGMPYVGEIRMFAGNFAPVGWEYCDGRQMSIAENETLFQLIGTTYGGDGQNYFNLPDLRGRIPIHQGVGPDGITYVLSESGGVESVTLTMQQIPAHTHTPVAYVPSGNQQGPGNGVFAGSTLGQFNPNGPVAPMNVQALSPVGGSQPHENMQPYLCVTFIISLYGVFPQPS